MLAALAAATFQPRMRVAWAPPFATHDPRAPARNAARMKIAYLDCASGISGDMTLGALVDAGVDLDALNAGIQTLGLPGARLVARHVKKKGFRATQITVEHEPEHKHRHLHHIAEMIDRSAITPPQKELAQRIFRRLAGV